MLKKEQAEQIEKTLGLPTGAITSPEEMDVVIKPGEYLTAEDRTALESNIEKLIGKKKYDEGKIAAIEMELKAVKKAKGLETVQANSFAELLDKAIADARSTSTATVDETVKQLQKEKAELQAMVQNKDQELNKKVSEMDAALSGYKAKHIFQSAASAINIAVPMDIEKRGEQEVQKFLTAERNKIEAIFERNYAITFEEDKPVIVSKVNNEKIVDTLKNPVPVDQFVTQLATDNYIAIKQIKRTGRDDEQGAAGGDLKEQVKRVKTREELDAFFIKNEVKPLTAQADQLLNEWRKSQN